MTAAGDRVSRARSLRSAADAVDLYRDWAADYDRDVFDVLGFTGTDRVTDLLAEHVADRTTRVVDLGCGTGVAGVRLAQHGFVAVDGIDISPEMIEIARSRRVDGTLVYDHLVIADLTAPISVEHRYGASVSAGTFTTGHVGAAALPSIVSLLLPGAVVAWVIAQPMWPSFEPVLREVGVRVVRAELEPIRRDGPPEAMMVVGRLD